MGAAGAARAHRVRFSQSQTTNPYPPRVRPETAGQGDIMQEEANQCRSAEVEGPPWRPTDEEVRNAAIRRMAAEMDEALRDAVVIDAQGRAVHLWHSVEVTKQDKDGTPLTTRLWSRIDNAEDDFLVQSLTQRRNGLLNDVISLHADLDFINDRREAAGKRPLQLLLDFSRDEAYFATFKPEGEAVPHAPDRLGGNSSEAILFKRLRNEPIDPDCIRDFQATAARTLLAIERAGIGRPGIVEHEDGATAVFVKGSEASKVYRQGQLMGLTWAETVASIPQLRRIEESALKGGANEVPMSDVLDQETVAFVESFAGEAAPQAIGRKEFVLGFLNGALGQWRQVKDRL
jgi:hypothetical protein